MNSDFQQLTSNVSMDKLLIPQPFNLDPDTSDCQDEWIHWRQKLQNFFSLQVTVTDDQKRFVLINLLSSRLYLLIKDSRTFDSALNILDKQFQKPVNAVFNRFQLHTCRQDKTMNIQQYVRKLEELATKCNFEDVDAATNRRSHIIDALVHGLLNSYIRERILESNKTDFDEIVLMASSLEAAQQQAAVFTSNDETRSMLASVSADNNNEPSHSDFDDDKSINAALRNKITKRCYFCGNHYHPRSKCPARDVTCNICSKHGHFAKVCQSKLKFSTSTSSALCSMSNLEDPSSLTSITINGQQIECLLDTGSSENFIDTNIAHKLQLTTTSCCKTVYMASSSSWATITKQCTTNIELNKNTYPRCRFSLLSSLCADAILGREFMKEHEFITFPFGGNLPGLTLANISPASAIKIQPLTLFPNLPKHLIPVATKSRRQTLSNAEFIRSQVANLLKSGIIRESRSPWRSQVLVVTNRNGRQRMVVDYSQTINRFTSLDAYPLPNIDDLISKIATHSVFSTLDLSSAYYQIPLLEEDKKYTAFEASGRLYEFQRIPFGLTNAVSAFQRIMNNLIEHYQLEGVFAYLDDIIVCGNSTDEHDKRLDRLTTIANQLNIKFSPEKSRLGKTQLNFLGYHIRHGCIKPDTERIKPFLTYPIPENHTSLQRLLGMLAYYSRWIPSFSAKIRPLVESKDFPLDRAVIRQIEEIKSEISNSFLCAYNPDLSLTVETDASYSSIGAVLSQNNCPVAFYSRSLPKTALRQSSVEKEAYAIVEALKYWKHFLLGRYFIVKTDQRSVSFMFDQKLSNRIKSDKIARWRIELAPYNFGIEYRPGQSNKAADAMSRITCSSCKTVNDLKILHNSLCHPGVSRLLHYVRSHELPFDKSDVADVVSSCQICAELKPRYARPETAHVIKATHPFERLSIDFKGPLTSTTENKYLLCVVDEYSRFPFAIPCKDTSSISVINCLNQIFSVFGYPANVHSDQATCFQSNEFRTYLNSRGISCTRSSCYNPRGNGQAERFVGIIWKTTQLALKTHRKTLAEWEFVLPLVLSSLRSLLCTAIGETPHQRLFSFPRNSCNKCIVPRWLGTGENVLLNQNPMSKSNPLFSQAEILQSNGNYATIRKPCGKEMNVSVRRLTRYPITNSNIDNDMLLIDRTSEGDGMHSKTDSTIVSRQSLNGADNITQVGIGNYRSEENQQVEHNRLQELRRSPRDRRTPKYLDDYIIGEDCDNLTCNHIV